MILTDLRNTIKKWWQKISFHKHFKAGGGLSMPIKLHLVKKIPDQVMLVVYGKGVSSLIFSVKALSHGAIFLATCNAILLLRDVN